MWWAFQLFVVTVLYVRVNFCSFSHDPFRLQNCTTNGFGTQPCTWSMWSVTWPDAIVFHLHAPLDWQDSTWLLLPQLLPAPIKFLSFSCPSPPFTTFYQYSSTIHFLSLSSRLFFGLSNHTNIQEDSCVSHKFVQQGAYIFFSGYLSNGMRHEHRWLCDELPRPTIVSWD